MSCLTFFMSHCNISMNSNFPRKRRFSMKKYEILLKIKECGIVAVIRGENIDEAVKITQACLDGGIYAIEITYTVPGATQAIEHLKQNFQAQNLLVGAGTVLDSETARIAILAGAGYIVSPAFSTDTAALCNRYSIPYIPGIMTVNEIIRAMECGVDVCKLFPGSEFSPSFIKAVKGPLPNAEIMPTGGVSLDNAETWIKNGAFAIGAGSDLTAGSKTGNYKQITETAEKFIAAVKNARAKK